uniref:NB-ARC domain-containing protein n=1 Tax=Fagus sylvatica TaxID=28930 RepID=A0A2N9G917_FAGSY
MADAFISVILEQFASIIAREAEQEIRQATDEAVKLWLKKLEDISYEMDDVLDEWNTAMIKLKIEKDEEENTENAHVVKKKVCSFIPSPSCCFRQVDKLFLRHDIAHKIKELSGKLDEIVRERERDDLVNILLGKGSEEEISPYVISLVGVGDIGKTALAQLPYNDVEEKMFFLVLDDVWTEDHEKWEPFRNALKCGSRGSRILVTTRNNKVVDMMGSARTINLEVLSKEDCWLVFSKIAFSGKAPEKFDELEVLGRQIAKKCKGLPLAAKTLGSLMRFKISSEQWKNVLDSNLWDLEGVGNVIEKDLFASLFLSYYDLPSPLKRCFSYCAVYPKDYVFSSDELVEMWMAQGYIDSKENMEIIAREYFENLAIRSFFQDFEKDEDDGQIRGCKMHDIVHDFAQIENDVSVLNALESPPNLKDLSISWYEGTTMSPNWTMSLTKLKTLCLNAFKNLEHLPPLGKLPVLESLIIRRFNSLRKVGVEFLGIESENKKEDNMQIFPNLKSLEFRDLEKWEEWIGIGGKREDEEDSTITIMPRLQQLKFWACPNLKSAGLPSYNSIKGIGD